MIAAVIDNGRLKIRSVHVNAPYVISIIKAVINTAGGPAECGKIYQVDKNKLIRCNEVIAMKNQTIRVRHYNRKKEEINILSEENRSKIKAIVFDVVNRMAGR